MDANIQEQFSEQLQLLARFLYSDLHMPYSGAGYQTNKHLRSPDTNHDIRILDTISVALTTGESGDVYAAAFDKKSHLALVLAKNGAVTSEDTDAADTLVSLLSSATSAEGFYPFLIGRCKLNIEKRINNVRDTIEAFLGLIDEALARYQPLPLDEELPGFPTLQKALYAHAPSLPPTTQIIRNLFDTILRDCKRIKISEERREQIKFAVLCGVAFVTSNSRFLGSICADQNRLHTERKLLAEKLRRRLRKLSQYDHGINTLIDRCRRFQGGEFSVRWVSQNPDIEEPVIELVDYVTAIQHNLHPNSTITAPQIHQAVAARNPALVESWNCVVHTYVHAEIRIILDFLQQALLSDTPVESTVQQPIGCSKRSCLACTLWIEGYNHTFKTEWMTSGSHGKPYAGWTIPTMSNGGGSGIQRVNQHVIEQISTRVHDVLEWLIPNYVKRVSESDEHYSSDSSEDEVPRLTMTKEAITEEYSRMSPEYLGQHTERKQLARLKPHIDHGGGDRVVPVVPKAHVSIHIRGHGVQHNEDGKTNGAWSDGTARGM
jgi:hypothetical protein